MSELIVPAPENQSQTTDIRLNPAIGSLLAGLLNLPANAQLFCNTYEQTEPVIERLIAKEFKVSAVSTTKELPQRASLSVTQGDNLAFFQPKDQFHTAFGCYPFLLDPYTEDERSQVMPVPMQDRLEIFRCAEGKRDRWSTTHMIGLEALLKSVHLGAFFAAVLPKRWVGREMKYMRWWQENAATVARIALPESAVSCRIVRNGEPIELVAPGKWSLWVWQRPMLESEDNVQSLRYRKMVQWAQFRYTPFVFPLETLDSSSIERCLKSFGLSDWYHQGVKLNRKMLETNVFHNHFGTHSEVPHGLPAQKDVWFFENPNKEQDGIVVVEAIDENFKKANRKIIHIKPGSSRTKLAAYNLQSKAALLDVMASKGVAHGEGGRLEYNLSELLSRKPYSEIRNLLAMTIRDFGMTPVITRPDYHRMRRQEIWLERQLTPVERVINVRGHGGDTGNENEENWETLYEDSGMYASYPEVMQQWHDRAAKMKLETILYPQFQIGDICVAAAKQSILLGNHMGLGKTREALAAALLRGSEKVLIVVPAKLVNEWTDEIQNTIIPYARRVRRDWRKKVLNVDFQVIEYAEHCLPHNLKRFNIISFDKLKSIPRDGRFFKCPQCGTVVYSAKAHTPQFCPGLMYKNQKSTDQPLNTCNNRIKAWKNQCLARGLRKHLLDVSTGKKYDYYRDWERRYARLQSEGRLSADVDMSNWTVVDPRPPRPQMELMEMQVNQFKKQQPQIIMYETNERTGEKKPVIRNTDRKSHVAWTFSDLLRWTFSMVIVDEAYFAKNEDALRSQALTHLCSPHKMPMTGTLIKGYPQSILNIENWTFKRSVMPDYRTYEGGEGRFLAKFSTEVKIGGVQLASGEIVGGKSKQVPKINNPELFQAEMAPLMIRHTRNEPNVRAAIPRKIVVPNEIEIEMDDKHRAYYSKWLEVFAEWWQKMKEEEEGRAVNQGDLLTKITYLINASTIPHYMLENILKQKDEQGKQWMTMIGKYKGPATRKMLKCWNLIREAVKVGDKTIVFSTRRRNLVTGQDWCEKKGFYGMVIDGTVPLKLESDGRSKRHKMVQDFRTLDYHVMWAGLGALAEGMNIPEANRGIMLDTSWDPAEARQAIGRMIRPQQTKTIYSTFLMHKGTIDGYMAALCYLKGRSSDEGLDYMEFSDFSTEMIPDIKQYADAIVDGTEEILKQKMWLAVEHVRNLARSGEEEGSDV